MEIDARRMHTRVSRKFVTKISKLGLCSAIEGMSENISQGGALIKAQDWHALQLNDRAIVTFFLPPSFSGQDKTICLQGTAVVVRLVKRGDGIAVQFTKLFKQFELTDVSKVIFG